MQAGDVGVVIEIHIENGLSGATCVAVILKPNGNAIEVPAIIADDDALSASYTTTGDDFDLPGEYQLQLFADWAGSRVGPGRCWIASLPFA